MNCVDYFGNLNAFVYGTNNSVSSLEINGYKNKILINSESNVNCIGLDAVNNKIYTGDS